MDGARVCMCLCVMKSAQVAGKLIFGLGVALQASWELQKYQNGFHDLDFDLKNETKVRSYEILVGHISGSSQRRIKMFDVLRWPIE